MRRRLFVDTEEYDANLKALERSNDLVKQQDEEIRRLKAQLKEFEAQLAKYTYYSQSNDLPTELCSPGVRTFERAGVEMLLNHNAETPVRVDQVSEGSLVIEGTFGEFESEVTFDLVILGSTVFDQISQIPKLTQAIKYQALADALELTPYNPRFMSGRMMANDGKSNKLYFTMEAPLRGTFLVIVARESLREGQEAELLEYAEKYSKIKGNIAKYAVSDRYVIFPIDADAVYQAIQKELRSSIPGLPQAQDTNTRWTDTPLFATCDAVWKGCYPRLTIDPPSSLQGAMVQFPLPAEETGTQG